MATPKQISKKIRRNETEDFIFGQPRILPRNQLPTYLDVGKAILHSQLVSVAEAGRNQTKNTKNYTIFTEVANQIIGIWQKASIPVQDIRRIIDRLDKMWKKKNSLRRKKEGSKEIVNIKDKWSELFDICSCKCTIIPGEPFICICTNDKKVPKMELNFLADQRGPRLCTIGDVDKKVTAKLQNMAKRKEKVKKFLQKQKNDVIPEDVPQINQDNSDQSTEHEWINDSHDKDYEPINQTKSRNYMSLENLVKALDRCNVNSVTGAFIANAVMKDFGILNESNIIDRSKLDRQRQLYRVKEQKKEELRQKSEPLTSIYFDSRIDMTLAFREKNGKRYKTQRKEEHISLIEEPRSLYLGHVTPKGGTGLEIATSLFKWIVNSGTADTLTVIGADSCNTNTGYLNGVITILESFIGRPLQRFICLLHTNELPLRAAMLHYVGRTIGPNKYSGPISKKIHDPLLTELPIVDFEVVSTTFPVIDKDTHKDLSSDQLYLYDICHGIISGEISPELAARQPGTIGHARWLTTASSVLRLYVSTSEPSPNLCSIVNIIMRLYARMWFQIKSYRDKII